MPTLLIIVSDRISSFVDKGEVIERYYNPGEVFDNVHILLTNDDQPDMGKMQHMVGHANLTLHNLPAPTYRETFAWQSFLMRDWVRRGVELARQIKPDVIRTYGNYENGYLGAHIRQQLGIPLIVSLHVERDYTYRRVIAWYPTWKQRLMAERSLVLEETTLRAADLVLPVYESIVGYAKRRGARRIQVAYNVISPSNLRRKDDYRLHTPPRILSVGRQFHEKNPDNVIRAVARLDAELTMVGDGEYHDHLVQTARECGISDRVHFFPSIENDRLCAMLPEYDIFATHSDYPEISKSVLEPLLTGLPIILNTIPDHPVPEYQGDWIMLVENTPEGYYAALNHLLTDHQARESLGRLAYAHAQERYAPAKTEAVFASIYRSFLK